MICRKSQFQLLMMYWNHCVADLYNKGKKNKKQFAFIKKLMNISEEDKKKAITNYLNEKRNDFKFRFILRIQNAQKNEGNSQDLRKMGSQSFQIKTLISPQFNKLNNNKKNLRTSFNSINGKSNEIPKFKLFPTKEEFIRLANKLLKENRK